MMHTLDERDQRLLQQRVNAWDIRKGPRVGDYCQMLDGTLRRFTHDWGNDIQTTVGKTHPCNGDSSFYFGLGYMSFSGSLDRAILKTTLADTGTLKPGSVWFFHHDEARAHNGVYATVACRVFKQIA